MSHHTQPTPQPNDNRMAWIRNIESLTQDETDSYLIECEFVSEARITGVLSYGNDALLCGGLEYELDEHGLYRYLLRIKHASIRERPYNKTANKKGYYFKEGILGELLAIFSLFFQARFYPVATYMGELTSTSIPSRHSQPLRYQKPIRGHYPKLFDKNRQRSFNDLEAFLHTLRAVPADNHHDLIRSIDHYARALREVGVDAEMVFIRLVSSIEAISGGYTVPQAENPLHGVDFTHFDGARLTDAQRKQLREILKANGGKVHLDASKKKFLGFLNTYSVGCLRGGNRKAKHCKVYRKDVPKHLKNIYDTRSAYLHDGQSMYISEQYAAGQNWDIDPSLGMIIDNHQFSGSTKLPHPSWFENLVRHSLLKYIASQVRKATYKAL